MGIERSKAATSLLDIDGVNVSSSLTLYDAKSEVNLNVTSSSRMCHMSVLVQKEC